MNARDVGRAQVELRRADQRDAERAEGVAQRGPLRHGRHLHHAQRHADDRAQHQRDGDPLVVDDLVVEQRAADRQEHPQLAGQDAAAAVAGELIHFSERMNRARGDEVRDLDDVFAADHGGHGFCRAARS